MKKSKAMKIIEKTALQHGVSVAEVRRGVDEAIDIAYEKRDESTAEFWKRWKNRKPTIEEFIVCANKAALDKLNLSK